MVYNLTIVLTIVSERVATKMSNGSDEENIAFDRLLSALGQIPIPPSSSPDTMKEGSTTARSANLVNRGLWQESYMWSLTSSSLPPPNSLSDDEERLISPLQVCCSKYTNKLNITVVILKMTSDS